MNEKRKKIISRLMTSIQNGEIVVDGKLLPERKLAELFNESRTSLREGLIALEAIGVLDIRDRQGIFVSSYEESNAKDLLQNVRGWPADMCSRAMELRQIIEPSAAALAALRRDQNDLEKLSFCLDKLKPLSHKSDIGSLKMGTYWNQHFHMVVVRATHNLYLTTVYKSVLTAVKEAVYIMRQATAPDEFGGRAVTYADHERMFRFIEAKDAKGAMDCAACHLNHTIKAMVELREMAASSDLFGNYDFMADFNKRSESK